MPFPNIDPIAFSIGPVDIRWYGLAYFAGLALALWAADRLARRNVEYGVPGGAFDAFTLWAIAGVLIGGRLGSILLYNPEYYLANPLKVFAVWESGMAFHGGFLGVVIAALLYCRPRNIPFLGFSDIMACVSPIGIFLVRIANYINGELWGRPTDAPWAVVFPNPAAGGVPRHPSQLYEAALEGVLLFVVINLMARSAAIRARHGLLASAFLIGYAICRGLVEFTREPDASFIGPLTRGQAYSVPMMLVGIAVIFYTLRQRAKGSS
ncbi:MAG: prolipoprotein diacylglyceryl transferase [Phycisphaerales bacterium]|nr:prolipoprotein diacylglyceryl transferase [Hyphomonadaceae bacterium]